MTALNIFPPDLRSGDRWLGEQPDTDLVINEVTEVEPRSMLPWAVGRGGEPRLLRRFRIEGVFTRRDPSDGQILLQHSGSWVLQEDQPLEVERPT